MKNISSRSSMKKKQRRDSFDDQIYELEKKIEARMEKSDRDRSVLCAAIANLAAIIKKAFLPDRAGIASAATEDKSKNLPSNKDSELDILFKKYEEAVAAKTKFIDNPDSANDSIVLYSSEYIINKAKKDLEKYWQEREVDYKAKEEDDYKCSKK
jgi:hypothetical protein